MSVPLLLPLILGIECLARDCMGVNKETRIGLRLGLLALGSSKNACAWLVQECSACCTFSPAAQARTFMSPAVRERQIRLVATLSHSFVPINRQPSQPMLIPHRQKNARTALALGLSEKLAFSFGLH